MPEPTPATPLAPTITRQETTMTTSPAPAAASLVPEPTCAAPPDLDAVRAEASRTFLDMLK